MKEEILNVLRDCDKALSIYDIEHALGLETVEQIQKLGESLRKLEEDALIYHTNKDRYMILENSHLRKGVIRVNKKGFGFVEVEGEDRTGIRIIVESRK